MNLILLKESTRPVNRGSVDEWVGLYGPRGHVKDAHLHLTGQISTSNQCLKKFHNFHTCLKRIILELLSMNYQGTT